MSNDPSDSSKPVLEPYDRISEVLFGLIMVLTFTGSLSVAQSGRADVRTMLIGALGCNLAWGLIDAILYLMGCLSDRGQGIRALRALQRADNPVDAQRIIADVLPPVVAGVFAPADYESIRKKLLLLPAPPVRPKLSGEEWRGAGAVFLWVCFTTFPVALPFLFMREIAPALRTSNAVAVTMLFITGFAFGRVAEYRPWLTGLLMVFLGCALVAITMALGG
jgi:VIT family